MLDAFCGCGVLFLFSSLTILLFLSVYAIFFVQGAADLLAQDGLDETQSTRLQEMFGSVRAGVLTLLKVSTGGDDWAIVHDVVKPLGLFYDMLFLVFVAFLNVALLNVVTATFCEKAMSLAVPSTTELIHTRQNQEFDDANELFALLTRVLDDDGSHSISYQKLEEFMSHPEVEIYFEVRGLKSTSAHRLFKTLCEVQNTDTVDFATFISACVKLDGTASSIDMHCQSVRALHIHHQLSSMQEEFHEEQKQLYRALQRQMCDLHTIVQELPSLTPVGGQNPRIVL